MKQTDVCMSWNNIIPEISNFKRLEVSVMLEQETLNLNLIIKILFSFIKFLFKFDVNDCASKYFHDNILMRKLISDSVAFSIFTFRLVNVKYKYKYEFSEITKEHNHNLRKFPVK